MDRSGHPGEGRRDSPLRPFADSVLTSTVDGELASSGLYSEVLKRNSAHYILHGVARRDGAVLGRLSLFRCADRPPFSLREVAALSSVIRYVSHGRAADDSLRPEDGEGDDVLEQELLIADRGGRIGRNQPAARG